jgi:4-amino-4-deoxy-L-arabinose transferase-like glycosyltransferase
MNNKTFKLILIIAIFVLSFFLRFYKLQSIPNGFRDDETSIGYNAYSILQTGKDEHNVPYPQNFKAFGEYKLPGYIYASVLPIKIFGLNAFGIRFVAALSGFLTVIIVFFLTKTLLIYIKDEDKEYKFSYKYLPIIVAFLIAINPWSLSFSRQALEVTLANFLILCGVLLFLKGIQKTKFFYIFVAIIFLATSMYTYNIARLFVPLLGLTLLIIFRKEFFKFSKINYFFSLIIALLCALPFVIGALNHGGVDSTLGTLIFTSAKVQAPLQEFRSYFVAFGLVSKIFFNYYFLTLWQYINNVFAHLATSFYFITGSEQGGTNLGMTGQWYIFELPFVIWGIVWLLKTKSIASKIVFLWILLLIAVSSLTREAPQTTRTFFLTFPVTILSGIGFYNLINKILLLKNKKMKYLSFVLTFIIIFYYVLFYFASYYVRFPIFYAKYWKSADRDASYYIKNHQNEYEKIIIDRASDFSYTSLLVYLGFPPSDFQNDATWSTEDSEGFTHPLSFGKFEIRQLDFKKDLKIPNALIITTLDKNPKDTGILKTIYYPTRPVVINSGQEITRYPSREAAYIFIETPKEK